VGDLSLREVLALAPLAVFVVWIGVQPQFFLTRMQPKLGELTGRATESVERLADDHRLSSERSLTSTSATVVGERLPK
jgi:NADH:ubiquinone oxidoreductase subunit 4 (subunit M)